MSIGENSHMLLHLHVVEESEHKDVKITFASPYVVQCFIKKRDVS